MIFVLYIIIEMSASALFNTPILLNSNRFVENTWWCVFLSRIITTRKSTFRRRASNSINIPNITIIAFYFSTLNIPASYKPHMVCNRLIQPSLCQQRTHDISHSAPSQCGVMQRGNPVFHIFSIFYAHRIAPACQRDTLSHFYPKVYISFQSWLTTLIIGLSSESNSIT